MKKTFLLALLLLTSTIAYGYNYPNTPDVLFRYDTSNEHSVEITLSATPGTVTTVTIPDNAIGFKLYPRTNHVRFAVSASVAAVATVAANDQTVAAADLAIGGIAKNDQWEVRILPPGTSRTLTLRSTTASVVVDLEVF